MTIGEKLRQLRLQNNLTQEEVAEYLNISGQSVSKWEKGNALPDITHVVPLANFFGVTTDELFDHTAENDKAELDRLYQRNWELMLHTTKETVLERVAMWREAAQKYPKNFDVLFWLATALYMTVDPNLFDNETVQTNAKEAAAIFERLLRDCTDNSTRECAIQSLVMLYGSPALEIADEETAVSYACMAGGLYVCMELLLEHAYFTEEGQKKLRTRRHANNLSFMDLLCTNIGREAEKLPPEEAVIHYEAILKLWETLIPDGNFLFYHNRITENSVALAKNYARLGKRDETLAALNKAVASADAYRAIPVGEQSFTSRFVSAAGSKKSYEDEDNNCGLDFLTDSCFDFVRDDADFPPSG